MKRILLTLEYDGTGYAGWQRQINGLAVQQVLEEALTQACQHTVQVTGASRTDAGVHATGQTAHFDTESRIPPDRYPFVLNPLLPPDIRVTQSRSVPPAFHARFLSAGKLYTYRIDNSRHGSALNRLYSTHVPVPLDVGAMQAALPALLGTHDFRAFQASGGTAKTTIRTLHSAKLEQTGDLLTLRVEGNAFLYNMVRIIAGTLIEIGHAKKPVTAFADAFRTGSRLSLGLTAPASGLELTRVYYLPEAFEHPETLRWHQEPTKEAGACSESPD